MALVSSNRPVDVLRLESKPCAITGPSVQSQQLTAALMLLAEVFGNTAADLSEGTPHNLAKVALQLIAISRVTRKF